MAILRAVKKQAKPTENGARPTISWTAIASTLSELEAPAGSSGGPFATDALAAKLFPRTMTNHATIKARFGHLEKQF